MTDVRSLRGEAAELASVLLRAADHHPGHESNFRHDVEPTLERIAARHALELHRAYELLLTGGGIADAVFNRLVVEWEPPGALAAHETHPGNRHATEQLRRYVEGLAERENRELDRLAGVACDGYFMIFARYRARRWIIDEPVRVDERSAAQLLESIFAAQSGRALTAANLLRDFGARTALTRGVSRALLDGLEATLGHDPDGLTARMYRQWETLFAVATGVVGEAEQLDPAAQRALAEIFGGEVSELHPAHALFALQTYFAVVTKLIALLALSLFVEDVPDLRLDEMAASDELEDDLRDMQHGLPFREAGLANVVEPDVFGWYLEVEGDRRRLIIAAVRDVVSVLKDYDPTTLHVSPEDARDLLKDLYQGLLPRPVRHALGQYFTPDWLAEQLLQQAEYDGEGSIRLVDPACGTGTFLVLAIHRLKDRLRRQGLAEQEVLECVLRQIVGFDIDPLAVVAARANYVLALGTTLRAATGGRFDVPVYLADSIVMPAQGQTLLSGDRLELPTAAGTYALPVCIDTERELREVCDLAARALDRGWQAEDFVNPAAAICQASASERDVLRDFYDRCQEQHKRGLNGLWPYVLRNAFMPAFIGQFDLVIGNPPWVN